MEGDICSGGCCIAPPPTGAWLWWIASTLTDRGDEACWLASVASIAGSAYRRPGARMLFSRDGKLAGGISGG